MSARRPSTEDHVPPSITEDTPGAPALLGAFPHPVFLAFPKAETILGRDVVSAAGRTDAKMSGTHARWGCTRGVCWIEDAASRNGTFVNGKRLSPGERVPLTDGAVVRLATTLFVFRSAHRFGSVPQPPLGKLVGPWGLGDLRASIARLRPGPVNVLIEGATGVGKELVAPEVVRALGRNPTRLGTLNVTSFPETVFDAQLFGWERGAFSGADHASPGFFREYDGGAVFLDEIGELPPSLQPKLLRVLENREVLPFGGRRPIRVDLVIVGATNRSLDEMVEDNDFRADLLARFPIRLPLPRLADRAEDLFPILSALWERAHGPLHESLVDAEAVERMMLHDWPSNVRELQRFIATTTPSKGIRLSAAHAFIGDRTPPSASILTREAIAEALRSCDGNQSAAARKLGVSRPKLRREMKKHGLGD